MTSDIQQIEAAIQLYFDGLYDGDVEKLAQVFNSNASLFIERNEKLEIIPVPVWFERVKARPSPKSLSSVRDDRVLMIDRVGPVNALAKVYCMMDPIRYTDYLSFIKVEGRWQIVAKAYCQLN